MDWGKFKYTDNGYIILRTLTEYRRTESGKSWRNKPESIKREIIPAEFYENYITAIPFFNNFENGAYCRARSSYTCAGYLPTTVTTVSPGKERKIVAEFEFVSKAPLEESAGWREREVMKNAKRFSLEIYSDWNSGHPIYGKRITFLTDDDGVTHSAMWDTGFRKWRD